MIKNQALLILDALKNNDCNSSLKLLLDGINQKTILQNNIIQSKLENAAAQKKYLKYKSKYLYIKNKII